MEFVSVGVLIYNQAAGVISTGGGQIATTEIELFNKPFNQYNGKQRGSGIKGLVERVNAFNATSADREVEFSGDVVSGTPSSGYSFDETATAHKNKTFIVKTYTDTDGFIDTIGVSINN